MWKWPYCFRFTFLLGEGRRVTALERSGGQICGGEEASGVSRKEKRGDWGKGDEESEIWRLMESGSSVWYETFMQIRPIEQPLVLHNMQNIYTYRRVYLIDYKWNLCLSKLMCIRQRQTRRVALFFPPKAKQKAFAKGKPIQVLLWSHTHIPSPFDVFWSCFF